MHFPVPVAGHFFTTFQKISVRLFLIVGFISFIEGCGDGDDRTIGREFFAGTSLELDDAPEGPRTIASCDTSDFIGDLQFVKRSLKRDSQNFYATTPIDLFNNQIEAQSALSFADSFQFEVKGGSAPYTLRIVTEDLKGTDGEPFNYGYFLTKQETIVDPAKVSHAVTFYQYFSANHAGPVRIEAKDSKGVLGQTCISVQPSLVVDPPDVKIPVQGEVQLTTSGAGIDTVYAFRKISGEGDIIPTQNSKQIYFRASANPGISWLRVRTSTGQARSVRIQTVAREELPRLEWIDFGQATGTHPVNALQTGRAYEFDVAAPALGAKSDHLRFVYRALRGNFDMKVQMSDVERVNDAGRAGLMVRASLAANAAFAAVFATTYKENGNRRIRFHQAYRGNTDQVPVQNNNLVHDGRYPTWMRLRREGNKISMFVTDPANGIQWKAIGSPVSVSLGDTVYLGVAATSGDTTNSAYVGFKNFRPTEAEDPQRLPQILIGAYNQPLDMCRYSGSVPNDYCLKWKKRGIDLIFTNPLEAGHISTFEWAQRAAGADFYYFHQMAKDTSTPIFNSSKYLGGIQKDEPDFRLDPLGEYLDGYEKAKPLNPRVVGNFAGGRFNWGREAQYRQYFAGVDWVSNDTYPITEGRYTSAKFGTAQEDINWKFMGEQMQEASEWSNGKPQLQIVESGFQNYSKYSKQLTPGHLRISIWVPLIYGATAVVYFPFKFGSPGDYLFDNVLDQPQIEAEMIKQHAFVRQWNDVLVSKGELRESGNAAIILAARFVGNDVYEFAANITNTTQSFRGVSFAAYEWEVFKNSKKLDKTKGP